MKNALLAESMMSLGIACRLLEQCKDMMADFEPLYLEIVDFEKRLMEGPMYTEEIDDLFRR